MLRLLVPEIDIGAYETNRYVTVSARNIVRRRSFEILIINRERKKKGLNDGENPKDETPHL